MEDVGGREGPAKKESRKRKHLGEGTMAHALPGFLDGSLKETEDGGWRKAVQMR